MAKYYGTNTTAHPVTVSRSSNKRTVRAMWISGQYFAIQQDVTTTVQRYEGIGYDDAVALCVSSESSTLDGGTTRNYLGGAKVENTTTHAWMYADACWGTRVSASMNAMSPNMYEVTVQTDTMDVTAGTGSGLVLTKV